MIFPVTLFLYPFSVLSLSIWICLFFSDLQRIYFSCFWRTGLAVRVIALIYLSSLISVFIFTDFLFLISFGYFYSFLLLFPLSTSLKFILFMWPTLRDNVRMSQKNNGLKEGIKNKLNTIISITQLSFCALEIFLNCKMPVMGIF